MSLTWITAQSDIANLVVGLPVSIEVQALNTANDGATLSYQLIGGSLPPGMTLSSSGVISGTPTYSTPSDNYFLSRTYNFIIRVRSSDGATPIDGAFSIYLTNRVNSDFTWITPAGNLGTVPSGEFYKLPLQVTETLANTAVTFSFLSGQLPPGMQVASSGYLQGVPTLSNATSVNKSETYDFSIRATNSVGHVRDQSFSLNVTNVYGPIIQPTTGLVTSLGTVFDGTYYSQQLTVNELNANVNITWSNIGVLPPGITLSSTGVLNGYIQPAYIVGAFGPAGFDGDQAAAGGSGAILQYAEYDDSPYDFNQVSQSVSYSFTIQAYDGANYDLQEYTLNVVSRSGYTADNLNVTVDNTNLTIDIENEYIPVLLNANVTVLPEGRAGSNYAYQFQGYDFNGDTIIYSLSSTTGTFDAQVTNVDDGFDYGGTGTEGSGTEDKNPVDEGRGGVGYSSYNSGQSSTTNLPGLTLDAATGWLYGKLNPQSSAYAAYEFGVVLSKTAGNVVYSSNPVYFTLPVLGSINDTITWITLTDLGTINNGQVSELTIVANSLDNKTLVYSLVDQANVAVRLPQGLELLPSGEISGRVSFEAFSIDDYTTTFDGGALTIDRTYKFTAQAVSTDGSISSRQAFSLTLDIVDIEPYDNLYLRALPKPAQRQTWNSIVSNTEIFVPDLIYRPDDPWFGVTKNIDMLFLPGLNPKDLATYANAIMQNHYTKTYQFGDIATAVVLNENYAVKYEVVYVNVIDPELNSSGNGPGLEINLTDRIANPYIDANGNQFQIVYPNTSQDMITRLVDGVGYYDQSSLPPWMTSNQLGTTSGTFSTPLGFTRAVVLAYTKPNASKLIAYRLNNSGVNFGTIEFTVDRYLLDDYYTTNFDTTTDTYISGRETTFDSLPNLNVGAIVAKVDYAVTVPFDQINGRPYSYIVAAGGIDGVPDFQAGDTLIFAKQENFLNPGPFDGWVNYTDAFIGDNTATGSNGYSSEGFDEYSLIPGFLEKAQGASSVNRRGGVWQINISADNIVTLSPILEILPNQKVQVLFGNTYGGAILYYDQTLSPGQTVPFYNVFKFSTGFVVEPTTFNGHSTRFFSYRDSYYTPNSNDKYVKFPQYGVFN